MGSGPGDNLGTPSTPTNATQLITPRKADSYKEQVKFISIFHRFLTNLGHFLSLNDNPEILKVIKNLSSDLSNYIETRLEERWESNHYLYAQRYRATENINSDSSAKERYCAFLHDLRFLVEEAFTQERGALFIGVTLEEDAGALTAGLTPECKKINSFHLPAYMNNDRLRDEELDRIRWTQNEFSKNIPLMKRELREEYPPKNLHEPAQTQWTSPDEASIGFWLGRHDTKVMCHTQQVDIDLRIAEGNPKVISEDGTPTDAILVGPPLPSAIKCGGRCDCCPTFTIGTDSY